MKKYKVFYDYYDGKKVPYMMVVNVKDNGIDWYENIFTIQVQAPFELFAAEEFDHEAMNISVSIDELTLRSKENQIGINLELIKRRLDEHEVDYYDISNFVIRIEDIEEVLQYTLGE
jgi:hypothetical protein